jgi:hypothetical protein
MPMAQFMHTFRFMRQKAHSVTIKDTHRARQLLRAIVRLHYGLWEYGIFDTTFKIENIGVVMRGDRVVEVVLVDGAEHTYDFDEAQAIINERKWRHCLDPNKTDHLFLPIVLHKEYLRIVEGGITERTLRKHWQKKSRAIEWRTAFSLKVRQLLSRDATKSLMLWVERQGIRDQLYQGIPASRVDTTRIPHSDLRLLLEDVRAGKGPLSTIAKQERAERTMYATHDQVLADAYTYALFETE